MIFHQINKGIDGTGGPQINKGIDGTGGPQSNGEFTTITTIGVLEKINSNTYKINGIPFTLSESSKITVDGKEVDKTELDSGQIITVTGQVDKQGNGIVIKVKSIKVKVSGEITQIVDPDQKTGSDKEQERSITVMNQTIVFRSDVSFSGGINQFSDLAIGQVVDISGLDLSNGYISATRIMLVKEQDRDETTESTNNTEPENNTTDQPVNTNETSTINGVKGQIFGTVDTINTLENTLDINALTINYSNISNLTDDIVGDDIRVQGISNKAGKVLLADNIESANVVLDNTVERFEIDGFITDFTSDYHFKVGDIAVYNDLQTKLDGGVRRMLGLDVRIIVEGTLDKNNVLIAEKIIFLIADFTSHKNNDRISNSTETFTWEDVGAEQYALRVMRTAEGRGGEILYEQTFPNYDTSATIHNLPINSGNVHVRISTKHSGWASKDYTFTGVGLIPEAEFTIHENNRAALSSSNEKFTWTEVPEAEAYELTIKNLVFDSDRRFFDNYDSFITSTTVSNLPNNSANVHVTLST